MSARTWDDLISLPREDLRAIAFADQPTDADLYQEQLEAREAYRALFGDEEKKTQEARRNENAAEQRRERRLRRIEELTGHPLPFSRDWITSGSWGRLTAAGKRVLPVVLALIDPATNQTYLSPDEIASLAGCCVRTAQDGARDIAEAGLVKRGEWRPNGGAIKKTWYSLPRRQPPARIATPLSAHSTAAENATTATSCARDGNHLRIEKRQPSAHMSFRHGDGASLTSLPAPRNYEGGAR